MTSRIYWRGDRVGSALRGENPTVLARMPGSVAVMGDPQWLAGYCVLLTDNPEAERLSDLSRTERSAYLGSMADLGEAVERACKEADPAFRLVNLEILGNTGAFLHAHVWPPYDWEPLNSFIGPCGCTRRRGGGTRPLRSVMNMTPCGPRARTTG